jgi:hypothetical protein
MSMVLFSVVATLWDLKLWFSLLSDFFKHSPAVLHMPFRISLIVCFCDIKLAPSMSLHVLKVATLTELFMLVSGNRAPSRVWLRRN